jgi:hypothetical protein
MMQICNRTMYLTAIASQHHMEQVTLGITATKFRAPTFRLGGYKTINSSYCSSFQRHAPVDHPGCVCVHTRLHDFMRCNSDFFSILLIFSPIWMFWVAILGVRDSPLTVTVSVLPSCLEFLFHSICTFLRRWSLTLSESLLTMLIFVPFSTSWCILLYLYTQYVHPSGMTTTLASSPFIPYA